MTDKTVNIENLYGNLKITDSPENEIDSAINIVLDKIISQKHIYKPFNRMPSKDTIIKIKYNDLKNHHIIKQYLDYSNKVEVAYNQIDSLLAFSKQYIFQYLNGLYYETLDVLGIPYLIEGVDIIKVRENSDNIIEIINNKLLENTFESKNTPQFIEQIQIGINLIIAHAFIECIILEVPK